MEKKRPVIAGVIVCRCTLQGAARSMSAPAATPSIPLCPGLTIVTAISEPQGDYESIKMIDAVSRAAVQMTYSAEVGPDKGVQPGLRDDGAEMMRGTLSWGSPSLSA